MVYDLELVDKAVDNMDSFLEKKGFELTTEESDDMRDALQRIMEERIG